MKVKLDLNGAEFVSGFIVAMVYFSAASPWWLLWALFLLFSFEVSGWPFAKLKYERGSGWTLERGYYE